MAKLRTDIQQLAYEVRMKFLCESLFCLDDRFRQGPNRLEGREHWRCSESPVLLPQTVAVSKTYADPSKKIRPIRGGSAKLEDSRLNSK